MSQAIMDQKIFEAAKAFLLQQDEVTPDLLDKYLCLSEVTPRSHSIQAIYEQILESAQNANMKAGVVGGAIGGIKRLGVVLCNFQPADISKKYQSGWEELLDIIEIHLGKVGQFRRESRSIWPNYCKTILSAAKFMSQFRSKDDFYDWVDFFDKDDRARAALPMILEKEIDGFGFALSCDFLKEIGYVNFAKPDVHLHEIFKGLKLCLPKADDYGVYKAIVRLARNAKVTPYAADKIFWLIGSGYFYEDKNIGKEGKIGSKKKLFLEYCQNNLSLNI